MEATILNKYLQNLLDVIAVCVTEAKLTFVNHGLVVSVVDPSHVAMTTVSLKKEAFQTYDAGENTEFGIDVHKVKELLKLGTSDEVITMKWKPDGYLIFNIGRITRKMKPIDPDALNTPKAPEISHSNHFTMNTADLKRGIKAASDITEYVELRSGPAFVQILGIGDVDDVTMTIPKDECKAYDVTEAKKSGFTIDYLQDVVKAIPSETVSVAMDDDFPVRFTFTIADGKGDVVTMIAPRIEGD